MSKRNNIEDFFNNSLDGFNERPSDQVWSGIEEMLEVKVPFWKTWKFWGWVSGISFLVIGLVSYQVVLNQKMTTLITQNTVLLEQNQLLTQEIEQTKLVLKQTEKEVQTKEKILNSVKDFNASETKINHNTSVGENAKEQIYFVSEFAKEQSDFSVSSWIDNRKNTNISTFAEANRIKKEREMTEVWQMELSEPVQAEVAEAQNVIIKDLVPNSIESKDQLTEGNWAKKIPLKSLSGISKHRHFLPNPAAYQRTNLALIKAGYIVPEEMKLKKPDFTPSLRLGLTGSVFGSISNIPNSMNVANNNGLILEWQAFRNFGFTGGLRYTELAYEVRLDADNQDLLQAYPNTENINLSVETISATHHYLDLPIGIIWKIPIGNKDNKLYVNPSVAWQFYLPQTFKYETFDKTTISTQNNRLYAYFGSTILSFGYEQKIKKGLRLQMGIWAESSFVEYGLDNRSGTNLGASATLIFGK